MSGLDDARLSEDDPLATLSERPPSRLRPALFAVAALALLAFLLSQGLDPGSQARKALAALLTEVRDPRWGAAYVLLAFTLGTLVCAPITLMFVATSLAVSAWRGFAYCMLGGLFGASLAYALGRLLGERALRRFRGERLSRLQREIGARPVLSVLIARFLPVGNFTLINVFLGSARVPYPAFVLGNVLGIVPGVLGITLCRELLEQVLRAPNLQNIALFAASVLSVLTALFALARTLAKRRRSAARAELETSERGELR